MSNIQTENKMAVNGMAHVVTIGDNKLVPRDLLPEPNKFQKALKIISEERKEIWLKYPD